MVSPAESGAALRIEVAYAQPSQAFVVALDVAPGTTAAQAVRASGLADRHPEIDPQTSALGIFGHRVAPDARLKDGDRVEVYRPLRLDPKARRRERAG